MNQKFNDILTDDIFYINGQKVCFYSWCLAYNIHFKYVLSIQKWLKNNNWCSIIQPKFIPDASKRIQVEKFLTEYMELIAEWDPTGQKARIPEMNKLNFYHHVYIPYTIQHKYDQCTSYKYFNKIWCTSFKHVRMTSKQRFSICSKCQQLNQNINNVCF